MKLPTLSADEHRKIHKEWHDSLDRLLADFLLHNPKKLPSTTTIVELMAWSHRQTLEAGSVE